MQAAIIQRFGPDAAVELTPVAPPVPAADEVLVRIAAAAVNPLDLKIIAGHMGQVFPAQLPYIPGCDFSGVVTAAGPLAGSLRVGARVVGRSHPTRGGAFAEAIAARADALVVMPDEMSFEQAAALPSAFGSAHHALFDVAGLQAGQRVLIHAGAGGVGGFAIQLARQAGAHVSATASAPNLGLLQELGAHEAIDYRVDDFTRLAPFDVILDTVGGATLERSWQVLREGGIVASLVDFSIGARAGRRGASVFFAEATAPLHQAVELFRTGKLEIVIDSLHALDEAGAALAKVASSHARGKVVIRTMR